MGHGRTCPRISLAAGGTRSVQDSHTGCRSWGGITKPYAWGYYPWGLARCQGACWGIRAVLEECTGGLASRCSRLPPDEVGCVGSRSPTFLALLRMVSLSATEAAMADRAARLLVGSTHSTHPRSSIFLRSSTTLSVFPFVKKF